MVRWLKYHDIADAVSGLPVRIDLDELYRVGRQSKSGLRYQREAGRRSDPMWREDDFLTWLARRLRHAPEIFAEIELRLAAQNATGPKKARSK